MMQVGLIGVGSGTAAALLFGSVTTASYLSAVLFYLAPLPLMIAGLGWSHWSALIGTAVGAALLAVLFGGVFFLGFLAIVGAPSWILTRLATLARPAAGSDGAAAPERALLWFPPGMLVVAAALLAAALVLLAFPILGLTEEGFHKAMAGLLARMLRAESGAPAGTPLRVPGVSDAQQMLDVLAFVIPPAAAVLATLINLIDLWLAGRIVQFSSRLARPWPQLSAMTFPAWTPLLLGAAIAITFAGGLPALAASVVGAALMVAYAVLGFAVLHEITRGLGSRPFVLGGVYLSVFVFGWPMLALVLLGLAETAFGLRARAAAKRSTRKR
jgi:hypothetical protein